MGGVGPLARTLAAGIRCVSIRRRPVSRLAGTLPPLGVSVEDRPRLVPDTSSSVRKDTVAAFSARVQSEMKMSGARRGDAREDPDRGRDGLEGVSRREREGERQDVFHDSTDIFTSFVRPCNSRDL